MMNRRMAAALVAGVALFAAPAALGVHAAGLFELEGNALDEPAPGDDWSQPDGSGFGTTGFAQTFVRDETGHSDAHFFRGSKTNEPISQWFWMRGPVAPAKDDLVHAFATAYRDDGNLFLYFGADRLSNEGAAGLGFWFFQDDVDRQEDGTFSGSHRVGDLLIVSQFTMGGRVSTIEAYRWVGGDSPLELVARGVDCTAEPPGGNFCATVNEAPTPAPWPYDARDSGPVTVPEGVFPPGAFFEGGIDVSALLPETECFSSFMALTSPSHVIEEELKDFVLGSLQTCPQERPPAKGEQPPPGERRPDLVLSKSDSDDPVAVGERFRYRLLVRNVGRTTARDVVLRDTLPARVAFVSASAEQGSCSRSGRVVTCRLGAVAPGAAVRVTIVVRATQAGSARDVAVVEREGEEVTPGNNRAEEVTRIRAPEEDEAPPQRREANADLVLAKMDDPDSVPVGGTITYTLLVRNVGGAAARDVVVRDTLPTGKVEFVSASVTQGSCGETTPVLVCRLGTIGPEDVARVVVTVRALEAGTATNVAVVERAGPEVTPANNRDVAVTRIAAGGVAGAEQVGACASLRIVGSPEVSPGERATVRLRARSQAGGMLSGAEVVARGPGVSAVRELNAQGVVTFTIRPNRAGVVRFFVRGAADRCTARLGVVEAVTGGRLTG